MNTPNPIVERRRQRDRLIADLEAQLPTTDREVVINLGFRYIEDRRYADAISLFEMVADIRSTDPALLFFLGLCHHLSNRIYEAIEYYSRASQFLPGNTEVTNNLAICYSIIGNYQLAYELSAANRVDYPELFSMVSMHVGDYQEGWQAWAAFAHRCRDIPIWNNEDLADKHLLIAHEQGFGDYVMMSRFFPIMRARCRALTVLVQPELSRLFRSSFRDITFISQAHPPPQVDYQTLSVIVPKFLGVTADNTSPAPYLKPNAEDVSNWKRRLAMLPGRKIGLRWSGKEGQELDQARSIYDVSVLRPFADVSDTHFISLELERTDEPFPLLNFRDELKDFADTAALMAALDLVITTDNVIANLAGAMGLPAWLMTFPGNDWRWGLHDQGSPWYPHVRIFRSARHNDWHDVVTEVKRELDGCSRNLAALS